MGIFPGHGLVLAGGASTRMGSDKATLSFRGETLIQRTYSLLSDFCEREVWVSCRQVEQFQDYPCLPDLDADLGPIAGLFSYFSRYREPVILLAVDLPLVTIDELENLKSHRSKTCQAVVARGIRSTQPLCAIYESSARSVVRRQVSKGNYAMFALLDALKCCYVATPEQSLLNLNGREDLEVLRSLE